MNKQVNRLKQIAVLATQRCIDVGNRVHIALVMAISAAVTAVPELAYATPTIGDLGSNAGDQSTGLTSGALRIAGFAGIICVIIAFLKGRNARQQGESIGGYITLGIVGALLFAIPTVISIVNTSLIGSDASSTIQGQIIE